MMFDNTSISWLYFQTSFPVDEKNIYYLPGENSVYVKNDSSNSIYKYCHMIQKLVELSKDSKNLIISSNDGKSPILLCIKKNNGIYVDDGALNKVVGSYKLINYCIDMNSYEKSNFILIDKNSTKKYWIRDESLFFNVQGLIYYKLFDDGIVYFDNTNTLYCCTPYIIPEKRYNTSEIEKIVISSEITYYIYMFNNLPSDIINIKFTGYLILLECSNDKFYYHTIESNDNFEVDKFAEIQINQNPDQISLLSKHYIIRTKKEFSNSVTLLVSITDKKFKKLLNIVGMLDNFTNFNIQYVNGTKSQSYGDGPKREFLEDAVVEFSNKYLINHNFLAEFDVNKFKKFTDDQLIHIGSLLHSVICHSGNNLPIRLPLTLLSAINNKKPNIAELEYFAKIENPDAFNNVYQYKTDPEMIKTIGFDSYEECLKLLCKYNYQPETDNYVLNLSKKIAKGFINYHEVKNSSLMNLPTLDYYISGNYSSNRDSLIRNLNISYASLTDNKIDYSSIIINIIKLLPEDKFIALLRNWSGTSIIKKDFNYNIYITILKKKYIFFGTCDSHMEISEDLFQNEEAHAVLVDMLTIPMTSMVDP